VSSDFFQILLGSFLLSLIHAAIPNHWLPLVALGRTERWPMAKTLVITAVTALAHVTSTIVIGIVVGLVGYRLSQTVAALMAWTAPLLLMGLGVVYLVLDVRGGNHSHFHHSPIGNRSQWAVVGSLALAMFFSPCLEIEAYYFTASALGWTGILTVSLVYLGVTTSGMIILVGLGLRGMEKLRWTFLEHHARLVTGLILIYLGAFALFL
jgi:putative Mn2+ efflux pump MntP